MNRRVIAGVDIGNSTTEVSLAAIEGGRCRFLSQYLTKTTGIKGTADNVNGMAIALENAARQAGLPVKDIAEIRINDAAPVIGDLAMDLISETIITESSMIGHNPDTPGGAGLGIGQTVRIDSLPDQGEDEASIVVVPRGFDYEWVAKRINEAEERGLPISGAVVQNDDGVLIHNRLQQKIPIVDEVDLIEKVPLGKRAAVEVALAGHVIRTLSNPYGLATVFALSPEETKKIAPIAKALVGNRSAVVIRTPQGEVVERRIEAGRITLIGSGQQSQVSINDGADTMMQKVDQLGPLVDVHGETGTNAGGMFQGLRLQLGQLTDLPPEEIRISDCLAVDAIIPASVSGAMAGEVSMESGVALASMVKTEKSSVQQVARQLETSLNVQVEVGGVEAEMAILGALTTPGTSRPLAVLDMGGGSTDAALIDGQGRMTTVHLAGAGDMVTMLIDTQLALQDRELAEKVKKYPLGKVMSLYHMQLEDGTMHFSKAAYPPDTFGRVVIREEGDLAPLPIRTSMEKIKEVRRSAKQRVFVTNALRALKQITPTKNLRHLSFVVMLGGSALDFEIPQMLTEELGKYGIVAGFGNIRGSEGPRNAVATGLILSAEHIGAYA